jgi:hypothetical protein
MAVISNTGKANIQKVKNKLKKTMALGESVKGSEFSVQIAGYPDLSLLISSTQMAPMQREGTERFVAFGAKVNEQGRFMNAQDITFTVEQVVSGASYRDLRKIIKNKEYVDIVIGLEGESFETNPENTVKLESTWIELEGADVSHEDGAVGIKTSGTFHANWVSWLDDEQVTLQGEG